MEQRKSKRNLFYSFCRRKYNTLESIDRISALPDSILGDILSLLPTKNAVATSTLSKRWKFLWRTVCNLDFYRRGSKVKHLEGEDKKFCAFVNNVLLHLDAGVLNKFRLEWRPKFIESHVTSWIKTAISRNVHELSLALADYRYDRFDMPISVFSCDSLRSLEFEGWICLSAANVSCLPRLEILHLKGVTFQSDEVLEKIIRGCPVLKLLHIDMKEPDFRFIISSTSLRRLEIKLGFGDYLKLETSSLEHLKLYCYRSVNFVQKNLSSLVEVDFGIYLDDEEFLQAGICNSVVDAVSALDSAKILTLSDNVTRSLSCATISLSTDFKRLVKLETNIVCCHWSSLQDFIQSSNNLEVLTVHQCLMDLYDENDHDHSNWTTPAEVPRCLSTNLKKVVLDGYNGSEDEREMIRYMLKHGSVLEVMEISCHRDKNRKKIELLHQIRKFPRKSPACKVKSKVKMP